LFSWKQIDNRYGDSGVSYNNNFKEFSMLRVRV